MSTPAATTTTATPAGTAADERSDLLQTLRAHRAFLRVTVRGLTDDQARQRTTVSELCLGGLVKHVAATEAQWAAFALHGADAFAQDEGRWADGFRLTADETLEQVLAEYDRVAARTDAIVAEHPDLDTAHPLPQAPWFPPGASWSVRRVLLHVIAETAQHSGHADVLRESLDGQKTMG
jgi:uncharacterized damage-inducible protein DinB